MKLGILLLIVVFFGGCATDVPQQNVVENNAPVKISTPDPWFKRNNTVNIPTVYWAGPFTIPEEAWFAVYGGEVIEVKVERTDYSDNHSREFVSGKLKVEKIFLDLPENSDVSIGSVIGSEDFDGLKKGDKAIIFINGFYEKSFVHAEIAGTNSKLGFKVKDWNEPIVSVIEKIAPCDKIYTSLPDGHNLNFRLYGCYGKRAAMILDDFQTAEIWKHYDPEGFQVLLERRRLAEEDDQ